VDALLRRLLRAALQRGLSGENWAWFVIAACALILRRALSDKGAVVSSLKISPGEQVLISVSDRHTPVGANTIGANTIVATATAAADED
jgi:hypothetical protein